MFFLFIFLLYFPLILSSLLLILCILQKWVEKIEFDIMVLSLINDHYANVQSKKEQARLAAELKAARKTTKTVQYTSNIVATTVMKAGRRKVLSESECRTQALLKAICRDGVVHIRPLCTSGDVLLAMHELLDPSMFLHGAVFIPHVLSDNFVRHTEGFYRYVYELNTPGQWQYLRLDGVGNFILLFSS